MQHASDLTTLLKPILFLERILWASMSFAVLLFVFVANFAAQQPVSGDFAAADALRQIFPILGAFIAAGAFLMRSYLQPKRTFDEPLTEQLLDQLATNPQTGRVSTEQRDKIKSLSTTEIVTYRRRRAAFIPLVVSLAMHESIAILGLVLAFSSRDAAAIYPYAGAALALNALIFPKAPE